MSPNFTTLQILGSLAWPVSFITMVLTCISWHYHHKEVQGSLSWGTKLKVMPFFFVSVCMKVWVLALTSHACKGSAWSATPVMLIIVYQVILHKTIGFASKDVVSGAVHNLSGLGRPTVDTLQSTKVCRFYNVETVASSLVYMAMAVALLVLFHFDILQAQQNGMWYACAAIALTVVHLVVTQIYLRLCNQLLFPDDQDIDQTQTSGFELTNLTTKQQGTLTIAEDDKAKSRQLTKWTLLITSFLATVGIAAAAGITLSPGEDFYAILIHSCFEARN